MKKVYISLFYLVLLGTYAANAQSPNATIDVQHYNFALQLSDESNVIKGQAEITVKYLKDASSFNIDLVKKDQLGKGMLVSSVTEKAVSLPFHQEADALIITAKAKQGSVHQYTISYQGIPNDGLIISKNKFGRRTFFGDNWPNRAHNWLPCVDNPADKATVDFVVTAPNHYQVVANGLKISETALPNELKQTHWRETAPLSTKVMVIGVADFAINHTGDVNNIPVYTYVFPENKDVGFKSYAIAKEILAYYIDKVGSFAYEKLANIQSKTIFGGMENASAIFYFENSVGDKGIEELMAHEIAHQWFGDAASEKNFSHLWLSEGFATYMTHVYLEHKYGIDTLKNGLKKDRETVLNFEETRHTAVVDTSVHDNYMVLLNANSYQKGGWVLHMLRRKLGDDAFWKGIRNYYAKYNGSNANTEDFRAIMEQASGKNLAFFFKQWLYTPITPYLKYAWRFDAQQKSVDIMIVQQQAQLFQFPLELIMGDTKQTVEIEDKITHVKISVANEPNEIIIDPNVNVFAKFEKVGYIGLQLDNKVE